MLAALLLGLALSGWILSSRVFLVLSHCLDLFLGFTSLLEEDLISSAADIYCPMLLLDGDSGDAAGGVQPPLQVTFNWYWGLQCLSRSRESTGEVNVFISIQWQNSGELMMQRRVHRKIYVFSEFKYINDIILWVLWCMSSKLAYFGVCFFVCHVFLCMFCETLGMSSLSLDYTENVYDTASCVEPWTSCFYLVMLSHIIMLVHCCAF